MDIDKKNMHGDGHENDSRITGISDGGSPHIKKDCGIETLAVFLIQVRTSQLILLRPVLSSAPHIPQQH